MWVYEEMINGERLSDIINEKHENIKYLPGIKLPVNVVCTYFCLCKFATDIKSSFISLCWFYMSLYHTYVSPMTPCPNN